jgi:hypothetical protein
MTPGQAPPAEAGKCVGNARETATAPGISQGFTRDIPSGKCVGNHIFPRDFPQGKSGLTRGGRMARARKNCATLQGLLSACPPFSRPD